KVKRQSWSAQSSISSVCPSGEKQKKRRSATSSTTRGRGGWIHCQKPTPKPIRTAKRTPSRVGFRADRNKRRRCIGSIPGFPFPFQPFDLGSLFPGRSKEGKEC